MSLYYSLSRNISKSSRTDLEYMISKIILQHLDSFLHSYKYRVLFELIKSIDTSFHDNVTHTQIEDPSQLNLQTNIQQRQARSPLVSPAMNQHGQESPLASDSAAPSLDTGRVSRRHGPGSQLVMKNYALAAYQSHVVRWPQFVSPSVADGLYARFID